MSTRKPACLEDLEQRNPQVQVVPGTRHWKIQMNGMLIAIYSRSSRKEGFAENTKSQLRRAGLVVGGRL